MSEPSDVLVHFACTAMTRGLEGIDRDGALTPLLATDDGTDVAVTRGSTGLLPLQRRANHLAPEVQRYALVWVDILNGDAAPLPTVFVEAGERGSRSAFLFAQRFQVVAAWFLWHRAEPLGHIEPLGPRTQRLEVA